jgi:hypothetical protein
MNVDIHLYQKRTGEWAARLEYADRRIYTSAFRTRKEVYEDVELILLSMSP